LELFTFLPIAPAMPFYLPKGAWLFNKLVDFMREETKSIGFEEVICPQMMTTDLWVTSGHMEHYKQNMFLFEEEETNPMGLKPMNCPGHASLFKLGKRSYKELPVRFSEYTKLHRNERGGVTHGIMRTRAFSQDDGHIFCTEDQILDEALKGIQYTYKVYSAFGFDHVDVKLATRPEQFLGSPELWDKAEKALADSLKAAGKTFEVLPNEGAFYGPKIEFHIKDAIGRSWQCGTIQLDFNLPRRFELEYTDNQNQSQTPVVIHRAILGSVERFMGILVEHHAGHLPIWVAPIQAVLINVTEAQLEYAQHVLQTLKSWGIRAELDSRNEKLGYRIREAQMKKIPLMLVLGEKEKTAQTLSVRKSNGETTNDLTLDGFRAFLEPWLKPGGTNH
jgi:threonyl-tRNA synthetase